MPVDGRPCRTSRRVLLLRRPPPPASAPHPPHRNFNNTRATPRPRNRATTAQQRPLARPATHLLRGCPRGRRHYPPPLRSVGATRARSFYLRSRRCCSLARPHRARRQQIPLAPSASWIAGRALSPKARGWLLRRPPVGWGVVWGGKERAFEYSGRRRVPWWIFEAGPTPRSISLVVALPAASLKLHKHKLLRSACAVDEAVGVWGRKDSHLDTHTTLP